MPAGCLGSAHARSGSVDRSFRARLLNVCYWLNPPRMGIPIRQATRGRVPQIETSGPQKEPSQGWKATNFVATGDPSRRQTTPADPSWPIETGRGRAGWAVGCPQHSPGPWHLTSKQQRGSVTDITESVVPSTGVSYSSVEHHHEFGGRSFVGMFPPPLEQSSCSPCRRLVLVSRHQPPGRKPRFRL